MRKKSPSLIGVVLFVIFLPVALAVQFIMWALNIVFVMPLKW